MKVVSTSPSFGLYSNEPIDYLKEQGIELIQIPDQTPEEELISILRDADAAILGYTQINHQFLENAPQLKIVCKHGVGFDNINLEATKEKGVWATNVPDGNKMAVADFAFSLMFSLARNIPKANELTKQGKWPKLIGTEIYGKTIGIVGLGRIGKEIVRRAKGFDMEILAYDPYPDHTFAKENGVRFTDLSDLLQNSDCVTLHLPLNDQTKNLIGYEQLHLMRKNAYLINVSRGGLIDEEALFQALSDERIGGAALDVFEHEPMTDHPLVTLPNFVATSHMAGYTYEAINNIGMTCVRNIVDVLVKNKRPNNVINQL